MFDKEKFIDDVLLELSVKVGNIDFDDYTHLFELKKILEDKNIMPDDAIDMFMENLSSITTSGFIRNDIHHVKKLEPQPYIDPYQVQKMPPVQDDEEDYDELEDTDQLTFKVETYKFDEERGGIFETGEYINADDVLTGNKFKCFKTGEVYYETKNEFLVKESDFEKKEKK